MSHFKPFGRKVCKGKLQSVPADSSTVEKSPTSYLTLEFLVNLLLQLLGNLEIYSNQTQLLTKLKNNNN